MRLLLIRPHKPRLQPPVQNRLQATQQTPNHPTRPAHDRKYQPSSNHLLRYAPIRVISHTLILKVLHSFSFLIHTRIWVTLNFIHYITLNRIYEPHYTRPKIKVLYLISDSNWLTVSYKNRFDHFCI